MRLYDDGVDTEIYDKNICPIHTGDLVSYKDGPFVKSDIVLYNAEETAFVLGSKRLGQYDYRLLTVVKKHFEK